MRCDHRTSGAENNSLPQGRCGDVTPEGMRHLIAETGVGQVVIGTDYPFPWNRVPVDHILSTPGVSDDDRIAILGGTAAKLSGSGPEQGWISLSIRAGLHALFLTLRPPKLPR